MMIFCTTTVGSIIQTCKQRRMSPMSGRSLSARSGVKRTLSVCAPVLTENVNCTSMTLFATHPSLLPQPLGKAPGVEAGTKWFVCAVPPSI